MWISRAFRKSFVMLQFSNLHCTKMKFAIKDFFSKFDQIRRNLRIWSHLLKKSLMENYIFCAVLVRKEKFILTALDV